MNDMDKRNRLAEEIFTYRVSKDGKVFIAWHGKQITTLKGEQARKLLRQLENAEPKQVQLALAKVTGHFKHGNER
jgi:hypothetical protein